ncbi:MAG: O-antigen ligase family protein [Lentisphaeria bacterium]|jgi:prepilin-type N-terminal cleavage/methylation domain-containing protein
MNPERSTTRLLSLFALLFPLVVVPVGNEFFYQGRFFVLTVVGCAAFYLGWAGGDWRRLKLAPAAGGALAAFFLLLLASTLQAPDATTAWLGSHRCTGFLTWLFCGLLFLLAAAQPEPAALLPPLVRGGMAVAVFTWLQHAGLNLVPHEPFRDGWLNGYGTMGNPNFLAGYVVLLLPAAWFLYLRTRDARWLAAAALLAGALLISQTRGAWLAAAGVALGFAAASWRRPAARPRLAALGAVTAGVAIALILASGPLRERAGSIGAEVSAAGRLEAKAGSSRIFMWRETLRRLPAHWALGLGLDHLGRQGIRLPGKHMDAWVDKAHNIFLELAVTAGVPALLLYLALLALVLRPWEVAGWLPWGLMGGGYLLHGLFSIDVIMVLPLFWLTLGLAAAAARSRWLEPGTNVAIKNAKIQSQEAPMARWRAFTLIEIIIVVTIIGLLAILAIPSFLKSRALSRANICVNNLRLIDSAKSILALEKRLEEEVVPSEADVDKYIKTKPFCPAGGTYDYASIGEAPKCSYATEDPRHALPASP